MSRLRKGFKGTTISYRGGILPGRSSKKLTHKQERKAGKIQVEGLLENTAPFSFVHDEGDDPCHSEVDYYDWEYLRYKD